jgi:hypothetical protein
MTIITLDFESFYSKTYSLSKLTTEEYVNGDEFEVIGVGVKVGEAATSWHTGSKEEIAQALHEYDLPNNTLLCHNTFFDATILYEFFGITAKKNLDTLSMARAIHGISVGGSLAKLAEHYELGVKGDEVVNALGKHTKDFTQGELARYGEYCINDVELTHDLFFKLLSQFNVQELTLIDITIKMAVKPTLVVDLPMLESYLYEVREKKEALINSIEADKSQIMSNPKFAALLEGLGVEPPMKVSPTTGKLTYAFAKTDDGLKALLEHADPTVQALVATRLGVKSTIEETRTDRFIEIAKRTDYLPIPLNYYGAATGRWSACLVADTMLKVYDVVEGVVDKRIVDVLLDDLIWDGEEFVSHEGVVFNGYAEVMSYDGITGTKDHIVFTEDGERTLLEALQGQSRISIADSVTEDKVESARIFKVTDKS